MTMLNDERIAEIGAKLASYGFKDHLGHSLTNCQDFQDLLAEVKALRAEKAQAEAERDVLIDILPSKAGCPRYAILNWRNDMDKNCGTVIDCTTKPRQCWLKYAQQQAEKEGGINEIKKRIKRSFCF